MDQRAHIDKKTFCLSDRSASPVMRTSSPLAVILTGRLLPPSSDGCRNFRKVGGVQTGLSLSLVVVSLLKERIALQL